jgi:SAM-dependent methyltransferase
MSLSSYIDTLSLLGDESRLRLCALLRERELCVTDLVRVTGIAQPRVSTHLGRLRDAGLVRDRRNGTQCFYALAEDAMPQAARAVLDGAAKTDDPMLAGDRRRLVELELERRGGLPDAAADDFERYYSPGLLELGDVLDVGSGDGAAAAVVAPYCRSLTCVDLNARAIEAARARLSRFPHARAEVADANALPFEARSFDGVLLFHTLTYAAEPARVLAECARVLRPAGRLVLLCLDRHEQQEITARYGEVHPGFSPDEVRELLSASGLDVKSSQVASREFKKPHLQVVFASADKPATRPH